LPLAKVDPVYFEKSYYLGPDKGGEKAYRLLSDAMTQAGKVALAKFVLRGKENLVLIRSAQNGLMLHTMYFADEVRNFDEISKGESAKISGAETNLALRLIDELSSEEFKPEQYEDEYRQRILNLVNTKAEGKEITVAEPQVHRAQVIDLMEALKESLGKKVAKEKKPAVRAKAAEPEKVKKRAQSAKK
jgi:DNA end-binding protein Ku